MSLDVTTLLRILDPGRQRPQQERQALCTLLQHVLHPCQPLLDPLDRQQANMVWHPGILNF